LHKDPERRLGGGPEDAFEIKCHEFFAGIDWQDLLQLKITPPFFPMIVSFDVNLKKDLTNRYFQF
jgi:RAC serine/threonine-protein kinase